MSRLSHTNLLLARDGMRKALGLAAVIIVLSIFLPRVLNRGEEFVLVLLDRATLVLTTIHP